MTIDQAIKIESDWAKQWIQYAGWVGLDENIDLQIVEWLKELKSLRNVVQYSKDHSCTVEEAEKVIKQRRSYYEILGMEI